MLLALHTECKSLLKGLLRVIQGMAGRAPVICGMAKGPLLLGTWLRTELIVLVKSNLSQNHFGKTHDWSDREITCLRDTNGIVWSWDSGTVPSDLFGNWALVHLERPSQTSGSAHLLKPLTGRADGKKNSPNLACEVIITHKVKERVVDRHTSHTAVMGVGRTPSPQLCASLLLGHQVNCRKSLLNGKPFPVVCLCFKLVIGSFVW